MSLYVAFLLFLYVGLVAYLVYISEKYKRLKDNAELECDQHRDLAKPPPTPSWS